MALFIKLHPPLLLCEDVLDRGAHFGFSAIGPGGMPGIGLPFGFLRCICKRRAWFARYFSLAVER